MIFSSGAPSAVDASASATLVNNVTPVKQKNSTMSWFHKGETKHEKRTEAVKQDYDPFIRYIPVDTFLESVLPPLHPAIDPDRIVKLLKKQGAIKTTRLAAFPRNPHTVSRIENKVFMPLQHLIQKIIEVGTPAGVSPTLRFLCNPDGVPRSINRTNYTRPDCYFVLTHAGSPMKWMDIGVTGELKKWSRIEDRDDNFIKTLWSMHHIIREDATHRFHFAFTIEDDQLKLWFCDRTQVLISTPFNFIKDHHRLVRFVLAFAFAPLHQVGWDPTMARAPGNQLDVTVRSKSGVKSVYRTCALLSDIGAECMIGRGTRVWKAQKMKAVGNDKFVVDHSAPFVTLKDIWIDADRPREGDIYASIKSSAKSIEQNEAFSYSFIGVECHGDVFIDEEQMYDRTYKLGICGDPLLKGLDRKLLGSATKQRSYQDPKGFILDVLGPDLALPQRLANRAHYRMVLSAVHLPLYELQDLSEICRALAATCISLSVMHGADWVHRDLTPGNILVQKTDSNILMAKIVDVEYAKLMSADTTHSQRSGMLQFQAIEVEQQEYIFHRASAGEATVQEPPSPTKTTEKALPLFKTPLYRWLFSRSDDDERIQSTGLPISFTPTSDIPKPPFRYNPLHDLESLMWICIYFLAKRMVVEGDKRYSLSDEDQVKVDELFKSGSAARKAFLQREKVCKRILNKLHPVMKEAVEALWSMRSQLVEAYHLAEQCSAEGKIDYSIAGTLYEQFGSTLCKLAHFYRDSGIKVVDVRLNLGKPLVQKRAMSSEADIDAADTIAKKPVRKAKKKKTLVEAIPHFGPYFTRSKVQVQAS